MKTKMEFKGLDKVMTNINQEIKSVEGRSMKGMIRAVIHIRREMEDVPPKVPIDTENLRASWFTNNWQVPGRYGILSFGFMANYAVFVHEMLGDVNWNRPGSGPRFLYAALDRNHRNGKILEIIQENAKV